MQKRKLISALFFAPALALVTCLALVRCTAVPHDDPGATKPLNPENFKAWLLPPAPPSPANNQPTPERIELGKMLFFDPRLSRDGNQSCISCHSPSLGWSDGLAVSIAFQGKPMARSSPTIINIGYNPFLLWDGRKKELEEQVMGPMKDASIMNTDLDGFFKWLNTNQEYKERFAKAYPDEPIGAGTLSKAIAAYERTIVSRNSPFDRWIAGDKQAMTAQQLRGLALFNDPNKGNCALCHTAPNFTDNNFHNLGLVSFGKDKPDVGRFAFKPVASLKGAFKTPTLRDIEFTAPYFHDGSAKTLMDVVEHYDKGGEVRTNLSPNIKPLHLSQTEKEDLVAFMRALSSPQLQVTFPILPHD